MIAPELILVAAMSLHVAGAISQEQDAPQPALAEGSSAICDRFEQVIRRSFSAQDLNACISSMAEYEAALLALYAPPQYMDGRFYSEAHGLSFRTFLADWRVLPQEIGSTEIFPQGQGAVLLTLQGPNTDQLFLAFCLDSAAIQLSLSAAPARTVQSREKVETVAKMIAGHFEVECRREWLQVGDNHALLLNPFGMEDSTRIALMSSAGEVFVFVLFSEGDDARLDLKAFELLLESVRFEHRHMGEVHPDVRHEAEVGLASLDALLARVRELAKKGEYGIARDLLLRVRSSLAGRLSEPVIRGAKGFIDAYGISVSNPDPKRWRLSVDKMGPTAMIYLQDRQRKPPSGIGLAALNTELTVGREAGELLLKASEPEKRELLLAAGRGALLNIGGSVRSERIRSLGEWLCYEGVAEVPATSMKAKLFFIPRKGHAVMITLLSRAEDYDLLAGEYEALLTAIIKLTDRQ